MVYPETSAFCKLLCLTVDKKLNAYRPSTNSIDYIDATLNMKDEFHAWK